MPEALRDYRIEDDRPEPMILGRCDGYRCDVILTSDCERYTDYEGNLFCSTECALEHYGVRELEVD